MIMGILPIDRGKVVSFNGTINAIDKAMVGYLPEERGLYDDVKVIDNLVYLAGLKRCRPMRAAGRRGLVEAGRPGRA